MTADLESGEGLVGAVKLASTSAYHRSKPRRRNFSQIRLCKTQIANSATVHLLIASIPPQGISTRRRVCEPQDGVDEYRRNQPQKVDPGSISPESSVLSATIRAKGARAHVRHARTASL